jgi:hypothetical protein
MTICGGYRHSDIVYDGKKCPLCGALEEIDSLREIIENMEAS